MTAVKRELIDGHRSGVGKFCQIGRVSVSKIPPTKDILSIYCGVRQTLRASNEKKSGFSGDLPRLCQHSMPPGLRRYLQGSPGKVAV